MEIDEISMLSFCLIRIKLKARHAFTLAIIELGQVTRVYRYFRDFRIGIPSIFHANWILFHEILSHLGGVYCITLS